MASKKEPFMITTHFLTNTGLGTSKKIAFIMEDLKERFSTMIP